MVACTDECGDNEGRMGNSLSMINRRSLCIPINEAGLTMHTLFYILLLSLLISFLLFVSSFCCCFIQ